MHDDDDDERRPTTTTAGSQPRHNPSRCNRTLTQQDDHVFWPCVDHILGKLGPTQTSFESHERRRLGRCWPTLPELANNCKTRAHIGQD